jgi:tetratricopeptide (TPR) repeat protein
VADLLAAGDLDGMDREIVAFRRIVDSRGVPAYRWWPALWAAMRALLDGRHADAEALAVEALEIGQRPFAPLAFANFSFLLFFLRREQGRLAEMEAATRDAAAERADIPAMRVGLTFLLAELGHTDEAAARLADLDAAALDRLHDRNWPASWFQLARVAMRTRDGATAARLLALEHQPTERCVTVSLGTVCLGATALGAAWLHHTAGDLDAADRAYRDAAELDARIGARSWLAQTRVDHARLLLERKGDGDHDAARELLALARPAVEEIGLGPVAGDLDELETRPMSVDGPSVALGPATTGVFRRAGPVWELEYVGRMARLPDARGLADLAHLLARPDEAVSVLELAGTVPGTPVSSKVRGAPALDDRARREIRDRLRDLEAEIDDADALGDAARAGRAREERQALAEAVTRDVGLGGRSRLVDDETERARKTVSTRIRRAIAQVGRVHPELGRHLDRSVDTGTWCAYRPADPIRWQT